MITQLSKLTIIRMIWKIKKWIQNAVLLYVKTSCSKRENKTKQNVPSESFSLNIFIAYVKKGGKNQSAKSSFGDKSRVF